MQSTDGHLTGVEVTEIPPDAEVVPATDDRIADFDAVQSVVKQAAERNGEVVTVSFSGSEGTRTADQLGELPFYDSESTAYRPGYYIEYRDQVIVVELAVQQ